ncbi:MAG: phosphoglycerate mutase family protein [Tissierellia bacterium]|nr:phosphoglycerate mutase family protein [Tissierellia bacterium]
MKITFIRHGEAVKVELCTMEEDKKRPLTPRGREIVRERFQKLRNLLGSEKKEIWTSPLVRARQTAEILSKTINIPITLEDFLVVANSEDLRKALDVRKDLNLHLFIVTHEPFISDFLREITGERILVHTGDIFTIDLYDMENYKGQILLDECFDSSRKE